MKKVVSVVILAAVAVIAFIWWRHIRNEFFVLLGSRNEAGGWYGFNSGAGGAFYMSIVPASLIFYWHHTCNASNWCFRWGKFPAAGGTFKLCYRHHPDLNGMHPHRELIHRLHREHRERK